MGHKSRKWAPLDKFRAVHPEPDPAWARQGHTFEFALFIAGTEKATPKARRLKAEGYLNDLKQNAGDTEVNTLRLRRNGQCGRV